MHQSVNVMTVLGNGGTEIQTAKVVIAIPTFRRLDLLERLLNSLVPELEGENLLVLVGDNDCDPAVRNMIETRAEPAGLHYVGIEARGVSQVRNGLIAAAIHISPSWRWLVMLDDDGYVTAGWFSALMAAAEQLQVDLIGGPVEGKLPAGASVLAKNSIYARRERYPTGRVPMLNVMQNVAINRSLVDQLGEQMFDPRLGGSGGEDHDLFKRARDAGLLLGWCDEAVVIEPTPSSRLTTKSLLYRYYSTGTYMGMLDCERHGTFREGFSAAKGMLRSGIDITLGTLTLNASQRAKGVLATAHYCGRLASLIGIKSKRYLAEPVS